MEIDLNKKKTETKLNQEKKIMVEYFVDFKSKYVKNIISNKSLLLYRKAIENSSLSKLD